MIEIGEKATLPFTTFFDLRTALEPCRLPEDTRMILISAVAQENTNLVIDVDSILAYAQNVPIHVFSTALQGLAWLSWRCPEKLEAVRTKLLGASKGLIDFTTNASKDDPGRSVAYRSPEELRAALYPVDEVRRFVDSLRKPGDAVYDFMQEFRDDKKHTRLARFVISNRSEDIRYSREYFIHLGRAAPPGSDEGTTLAYWSDEFTVVRLTHPLVASWDIFDTLLARKCIWPHKVFEYLEKSTGIPDLAAKRQHAERESDGTFDGIYRRLAEEMGWSEVETSRVKSEEIAEEARQLFPIGENVAQLREGDILVSDMYLPIDVIRGFLRQSITGLDPHRHRIYLSPAGKRNGVVWNQITEKVAFHTGDNEHSDVLSPMIWGGLRAVHYKGSSLTQIEHTLIKAGFADVACLVRFARLRNPYTEEPGRSIWFQQASLNLPILVLFAQEIKDRLDRDGLTRVLFTTRDCCLLVQVFQALYPRMYECTTFHSSRMILLDPPPAYTEYARNLLKPAANDYLIVDMQGTGESISAFLSGIGADCKKVLFLIKFDNEKGSANACNGTFVSMKGDNLEVINYDTIGTLVGWSDDGRPVRREPEYDIDNIRAGHEAVQVACQQIGDLLPSHEVRNRVDLLDHLTNVLAVQRLVLSGLASHQYKH